MSESENTSKADSSPPAPSPSQASGGKNETKKTATAPSPTPPPEKKSPPPPEKKSPPPPENKPPPPPEKKSPPPTPTQSPPPPAKQQSPPAPTKESSPPPPPPPSGSPESSTKSSQPSPSPPPPTPTGTSQPQPQSPPSPVIASNTPSSPGSPPQALVAVTPSISQSHNSNSQIGSSRSSDSNNGNSNTKNVSGSSSSSTKHLSYEDVIAMAVVGVLVVVFVILFFYMRQRKKNQQNSNAHYSMPPPANFRVMTSDGYNTQFHGPYTNIANSPLSGQNYPGSKTFFTYEEVMEMTGGFARQNVIGEGGFGCVFKGWMSDGKLVAVKQLKTGSGQGEREFRAEVEIISRVHHRHLVSLVGYSMAENQRLLLYEFVPNNTLEHHLHGKGVPVLDWAKRVKIALGAARGLAYLHEDCHPKIIHRDIKSANILLEANFEAKVADFGLARLNDTTESHVSTRVMGTFGYLAPEYALSGKLTDRSDVYSFGVVLLELLTGRKPIDQTRPLGDESLVEWARPLLVQALETGYYGEIIDPRLEKHYIESEMIMMVEAAAACVRHSATKRPRMALVVRALDFEGNLDLSNGVKYGDSTAYDSALYNEEISKFRQIALGSTDNSSDFELYGTEYNSEMQSRQRNPWESPYSYGDYTSDELETRALKP